MLRGRRDKDNVKWWKLGWNGQNMLSLVTKQWTLLSLFFKLTLLSGCWAVAIIFIFIFFNYYFLLGNREGNGNVTVHVRPIWIFIFGLRNLCVTFLFKPNPKAKPRGCLLLYSLHFIWCFTSFYLLQFYPFSLSPKLPTSHQTRKRILSLLGRLFWVWCWRINVLFYWSFFFGCVGC